MRKVDLPEAKRTVRMADTYHRTGIWKYTTQQRHESFPSPRQNEGDELHPQIDSKEFLKKDEDLWSLAIF